MTDKKNDFICPGAQKSGTTALFGMLNQHPSVFLPAQKEVYYFDNDKNYRKENQWYDTFFFGAAEKQIAGDITPDYILFPKCAKRIHRYNPDIKIIVMLRNPADRAFSNFQMNKRYTEENKSFDKALEAESSRIKKGYRRKMRYSYLERGFYYKQLKPYFDLFAPANIKIIIFEEFIKDIVGGMMEIEEFLGLPVFNNYLERERNNEGYLPRKKWIAYIKRHFVRPVRSIYIKILPEAARDRIRKATDAGRMPKEELPEAIRAKLMSLYHDDILELEKLINRDLAIWT